MIGTQPHRTPAERLRAAYVVFAIILTVALIALGAVALISRGTVNDLSASVEQLNDNLAQVRADQRTSLENGYKSAASICQTNVLLGYTNFPPDSRCRDPQVLRYYDPNATPTAGASSPGQQRNLSILCRLLRAANMEDSACPVTATP